MSQGHNGVAVVDEKHQVIVHAEAFGAAVEHDLLQPMKGGIKPYPSPENGR